MEWLDLNINDRYRLYKSRQKGQKYIDVVNAFKDGGIPQDNTKVSTQLPILPYELNQVELNKLERDKWYADNKQKSDSYWGTFGEHNLNESTKLLNGLNSTFGTSAMIAGTIATGGGFLKNSQTLVNIGNKANMASDVFNVIGDTSSENIVDLGLNFIPGINKYNRIINLKKNGNLYQNVLNPKAIQKLVGTSAYNVYNEFD